jgi:hypothetical protein
MAIAVARAIVIRWMRGRSIQAGGSGQLQCSTAECHAPTTGDIESLTRLSALLNVDMNSPPNLPILGDFEPQSPPELGDLGGVQKWVNPAIHTAIQQRRLSVELVEMATPLLRVGGRSLQPMNFVVQS